MVAGILRQLGLRHGVEHFRYGGRKCGVVGLLDNRNEVFHNCPLVYQLVPLIFSKLLSQLQDLKHGYPRYPLLLRKITLFQVTQIG